MKSLNPHPCCKNISSWKQGYQLDSNHTAPSKSEHKIQLSSFCFSWRSCNSCISCHGMQILNPITGQELKLHHLDQTPSLYFKLRTIEGIFAHYLQSLQYSHQAANTIGNVEKTCLHPYSRQERFCNCS